MARLAHGIATACLGAGLGVQLFLSYQVAPGAFRLIDDRRVAVRLMEGLFPGYYAFGLVTLTAALILVVGLLAGDRGAPLRWSAAVVLAVALAGTAYAGQVLLPRAHAARLRAQAAAPGDLAPLAFSRLHRQAVAVNIGLFGVGVAGLALHLAARPR